MPISGFSDVTHVLIFQDTFYLTDNSGNRQAYDINHATLKWKFTEKYEYCSPPKIETLTKTLITACKTSYLNICEIIGIDSNTGIVKWKLPLISPALIEKSTTLLGNFVYSGSSTGSDVTVNWMQMQTEGNPVQLYQWIGHYDEKRGYAHNILSSKEATAVSFHTGYHPGSGSDNSNIYFFDRQGNKQDIMTFSNQGEAFLANKIWDNSFVYTTRSGIFGIYKMKKLLS